MTDKEMYEYLVDYVTEGWRLRQYTATLVSRVMNSQVKKRGINQVVRFDKHSGQSLEKLGLEILDFTGQPYTMGMPVYPINMDDFQPEDNLKIDVTLEPTIKKVDSAEVLKMGSVVLERINDEVLCGD